MGNWGSESLSDFPKVTGSLWQCHTFNSDLLNPNPMPELQDPLSLEPGCCRNSAQVVVMIWPACSAVALRDFQLLIIIAQIFDCTGVPSVFASCRAPLLRGLTFSFPSSPLDTCPQETFSPAMTIFPGLTFTLPHTVRLVLSDSHWINLG